MGRVKELQMLDTEMEKIMQLHKEARNKLGIKVTKEAIYGGLFDIEKLLKAEKVYIVLFNTQYQIEPKQITYISTEYVRFRRSFSAKSINGKTLYREITVPINQIKRISMILESDMKHLS